MVMGIRHVTRPSKESSSIPKSILTPEGPHLLANFLRLAGEGEAALLDRVSGSFATGGMAEAAPEAATPNGAAAAAGRTEIVR